MTTLAEIFAWTERSLQVWGRARSFARPPTSTHSCRVGVQQSRRRVRMFEENSFDPGSKVLKPKQVTGSLSALATVRVDWRIPQPPGNQ